MEEPLLAVQIVHPHSLLTPLLIEERKVCEEKVIEKPPYKGVG